MLTLKYIRIRKDRPTEQCLASIWCDACANLEIPCVLIYLDQGSAYISASLKHLPPLNATEKLTNETEEKLKLIPLTYAATSKGYWKHSSTYFTFDSVPPEFADKAAAAIFDALTAYLHQINSSNQNPTNLNSHSTLEELPG